MAPPLPVKLSFNDQGVQAASLMHLLPIFFATSFLRWQLSGPCGDCYNKSLDISAKNQPPPHRVYLCAPKQLMRSLAAISKW